MGVFFFIEKYDFYRYQETPDSPIPDYLIPGLFIQPPRQKVEDDGEQDRDQDHRRQGEHTGEIVALDADVPWQSSEWDAELAEQIHPAANHEQDGA
jgi:hypothetical protein